MAKVIGFRRTGGRRPIIPFRKGRGPGYSSQGETLDTLVSRINSEAQNLAKKIGTPADESEVSDPDFRKKVTSSNVTEHLLRGDSRMARAHYIFWELFGEFRGGASDFEKLSLAGHGDLIRYTARIFESYDRYRFLSGLGYAVSGDTGNARRIADSILADRSFAEDYRQQHAAKILALAGDSERAIGIIEGIKWESPIFHEEIFFGELLARMHLPKRRIYESKLMESVRRWKADAKRMPENEQADVLHVIAKAEQHILQSKLIDAEKSEAIEKLCRDISDKREAGYILFDKIVRAKITGNLNVRRYSRILLDHINYMKSIGISGWGELKEKYDSLPANLK